MNTIYLYLHRVLLKEAPQNKILSRKQASTIISRYFKFIKRIKVTVIDDMVALDLIEIVSKSRIRLINIDKSKSIDSGVFLKVLEYGERIKDYDKSHWDSIDADNENLRDTIRWLQKGVVDLKEKTLELQQLLDKITLEDEEGS